MAFSTLIRSTAPLIEVSQFDSGLHSSDRFKVSFNVKSSRVQTSTFGKSIHAAESSSLQKCSGRNFQSVRATVTETPPTIPKSWSNGKTKIGINDKLKILPAPEVAVKYYTEGDLYLFDEFQTARPPKSRRPKIENLYDVFLNVRDDEAEHCKTMNGFCYSS